MDAQEICSSIQVTRNLTRTGWRWQRTRRETTVYRRYGQDGKLIAESLEPREGAVAETVTRETRRRVPETVTEAVTETLKFKAGEGNMAFYVVDSDNRTIGYLWLWEEEAGQQPFMSERPAHLPAHKAYVVPFKVHIDEAYQRLGIGTALYRFAQWKRGSRIYPARSQTDAAKALWAKLERMPSELSDGFLQTKQSKKGLENGTNDRCKTGYGQTPEP